MLLSFLLGYHYYSLIISNQHLLPLPCIPSIQQHANIYSLPVITLAKAYLRYCQSLNVDGTFSLFPPPHVDLLWCGPARDSK